MADMRALFVIETCAPDARRGWANRELVVITRVPGCWMRVCVVTGRDAIALPRAARTGAAA